MKIKPITNKYLIDFKKYARKLDDIIFIKREELSKEWIEKKVDIGNSILSLYNFNNYLLKTKKIKDRYYTFYFDLILSKIKHSLFTETPKNEIIDIHTFLVDEIAFIGENLLNIDEDDKKFKLEYQRFVFKIFLMYDVIYFKDEAIFTRFDLNRGLFNSIKKRILDSYNEDISFRDYGKDLIIRLLEATLDYYHYEYTDDVYKSIIDYYKKKEIVLFEPLSYYLIFKIWKYAKLIQSTLEYLDKKELDEEKKEFKNDMDDYIHDGIDIIDDFYNAKITNNTLFYKFYEIDKDIFDSYILNHVLPAYSNSIDIKFPDYESKYLLFSTFISGS